MILPSDGDAAFTQRLVDRLTEHDDAFLAACADAPDAVTPARVRGLLSENSASMSFTASISLPGGLVVSMRRRRWRRSKA